MKLLILFIFLLTFSVAYSAGNTNCIWCQATNLNVKKTLLQLVKLEPTDLLKRIENENIKIFILKANRKTNPTYFQWGSIRIDQGNFLQISKFEGSLGKTLCKNEKEIAQSDYTIILSSDATYSVLLHEYLHVLQIKKDPSWCETSKRLWKTSTPSDDDYISVRNHEWDVRLLLWELINEKKINLEDQIIIAEGLIRESELRRAFDPAAQDFIKKEKIKSYLDQKIIEYTKK